MIEKLLKIAKEEIGYLEKKSNRQLDDKKANAGRNNYTKYARDLDKISGFYNGKKQGYAWCDVFVDWCFVQAFGVDKAKELLLQPNKSLGAGCKYSMNYYKKAKQFHSKPKVGDQIFFKSGSSIVHTGLVYKVDNTYVYTIEGNTSSDAGVIANGGSVNDKKYKLGSKYIAGYGRPKYDEEVKPEPTPEPTKQVNVLYQVYDNKKKKWLGTITNYNNVDGNGYAGNFGNSIGGIRVKLSDKSKVTIRSHIKGGKWLDPISKWGITSNGYSGIKGKPIDGVCIKADNHKISYRVHTVNGKWLGWISKYDTKDWTNGVAGIKGKSIDAIQIKVD
jgi:hypothetical protein